MIPPNHLTTSPPQDTFHYIATWAENAARLFEDIDAEYDPGSDEAVRLRMQIIECSAHIFAAIVLSHPEARWRLRRGLDAAQTIIGPDTPSADEYQPSTKEQNGAEATEQHQQQD